MNNVPIRWTYIQLNICYYCIVVQTMNIFHSLSDFPISILNGDSKWTHFTCLFFFLFFSLRPNPKRPSQKLSHQWYRLFHFACFFATQNRHRSFFSLCLFLKRVISISNAQRAMSNCRANGDALYFSRFILRHSESVLRMFIFRVILKSNLKFVFYSLKINIGWCWWWRCWWCVVCLAIFESRLITTYYMPMSTKHHFPFHAIFLCSLILIHFPFRWIRDYLFVIATNKQAMKKKKRKQKLLTALNKVSKERKTEKNKKKEKILHKKRLIG